MGSVNEDEKTPQASAQTRKTWLENDLENHTLKLDHLDEEIVQAESKLQNLRRQRQGLLSHVNEVRHKLDDVTKLVDLEMENEVLRREVESLRNGKIL